MALSLEQIQYYKRGKVDPDSMTFYEMISLFASRHANYILSLTIDFSSNELAQSYQDKISAYCNRIIKGENSLIGQLFENLPYEFGEVSYAELKAKTDTQKEELIGYKLPFVMDKQAGITPQERIAWDSVMQSQ